MCIATYTISLFLFYTDKFHLSTALSYPNLTICSRLCATSSRIEPAIAFEPRWVLVGIAIAVVVACLIVAARILTRENRAASEPEVQKTDLPEAMPVKVAEKNAVPEEIGEPIETLASEEGTEAKVLLASVQATTAKSITQAEEALPSGPGLQTEEQTQKKPKESLPRQYRQTPLPLAITELKIDPARARPGETVTISFKATNMNDVTSYYSITLRINGVTMATKGVSLPPKSATRLAFTLVETLPGDYKVEVNRSIGRLSIVRETGQTFLCPRCRRKVMEGHRVCESCGAVLRW